MTLFVRTGPKDELNKFADVELSCYGLELYVEESIRCQSTVAALNGKELVRLMCR
jgi:hypothetical protein